MLLSLLLLASHPVTTLPTLPAAVKDPPVRVWFNSDGNYAPGDRAKVYAKAAADGYLIVLRSDPDGRVRVLFPLDPEHDQRITAGKKYELKGRGGREAFVADDTSGHGTVLAAVSPSPFRIEEFTRDGRWDSRLLSDDRVREDPEAGLIELVRRMIPSGADFEYDVATYVVAGQYGRERYPYGYRGPGWWGYDPFWRWGWGRGPVYFRYRRSWGIW